MKNYRVIEEVEGLSRLSNTSIMAIMNNKTNGFTISSLENYGDVVGGNRAGGIFGNFGGTTISDSINNGNVTSTGGMHVVV